MYIGKNLPHAKREAQERATRQGRAWHVYDSQGHYTIDALPNPQIESTCVYVAKPQGWGGPEVCRCGHNGYQHRNGGRCQGGHSLCRCTEFRGLQGGPAA